jgi:hypothetical protein
MLAAGGSNGEAHLHIFAIAVYSPWWALSMLARHEPAGIGRRTRYPPLSDDVLDAWSRPLARALRERRI